MSDSGSSEISISGCENLLAKTLRLPLGFEDHDAYHFVRDLTPLPGSGHQPNPERLIVSPKCPCKWGKDEVARLRVIRTRVDSAEEFFGWEKLRKPRFKYPGHELLETSHDFSDIKASGPAEDEVCQILNYIRYIAMKDLSLPNPDTMQYESLTDALVMKLMGVLGYPRNRGQEILPTNKLTLEMGGMMIRTHADVCIVDVDWPSYLLLVVEDKCICQCCTPFGQLVAVCIAAFQTNNKIREHNEEPTLKAIIFPAMIWRGTTPTFYLVKVTEELAKACQMGRVPKHQTIVYEYNALPKLTAPKDGLKACNNMETDDEETDDEETGGSEEDNKRPTPSQWGMVKLENRHRILVAMENLKDFIPANRFTAPIGWQSRMTAQELKDFVLERRKKKKPVVAQTSKT